MSHAEPSGRVALLAGLSAAFIAVSFGFLHRTVLLDWPDIALDGPGPMLAYFVAGTLFQFGIPVCVSLPSFSARPRGACGRADSGSRAPAPRSWATRSTFAPAWT